MQRQRSSMGSLPDTINFDHNPISADGIIDQPVFWNNDIQNYVHNSILEFITSSTNGGSPYLNSSSQAQNLSGWNRGESSSSGTQNYAIHSEQKIEGGPSNAISLHGVDLNQAGSTYSPLFMQSARNNPFAQDLNMGIGNGESNGNNRELVEGHSSGSGGYYGEEPHSSEDRRLSGNKRKVMEGHIGQSSSSGSSSYFQQVGELNSTPSWYNTHFGSNSSSASLENPPHANPSEAPQTSLFVPRAPQMSRWSRGGGSSSSSRPENPVFLPRNVRRWSRGGGSSFSSIPENPVFLPRNMRRYPTQLPFSWGLTRENLNVSVGGSSGRSVPWISAPRWFLQRTPPRYSRRLSEFRRSMLSTTTVPESGGQASNLHGEAVSSSQAAPASGSVANHMERQLDTAIAGVISLQSAASGSEGRRQPFRIRDLPDLMRRASHEGVRLDDLIIDQSEFSWIADIHDQHRDMRLDVNNMPREEMSALEERIGNVSTGLSEETIMDHLKQRKFFSICCICREEYNDGEDIGAVECGHEFHSGCIKKWLVIKNSCPICRATALNK